MLTFFVPLLTFNEVKSELLPEREHTLGIFPRTGTVQYRPVQRYYEWTALPPLHSISWYKYHIRTYEAMSTRLISPSQDLSFQSAEEEQTEENLQQEIECPRCSDIMTLASDFDKLLYFCQECQLSLVMK
jgi:hypothetical protein